MALIEPKFDWYLTGDWLDLTSAVRINPTPRITGGAKNESSAISPGRCEFTVGTRTMSAIHFNPRNPTGQYHGEIGKNTPLRVRVPLLTDNVSQTDSDGWGTNWVNGPSSGGTIADTNFTRSGTVNSHSVPAANAYRRSRLASPNIYMDHCVVGTVTVPTNNVATASMASRVEFRYVDSNNFIGLAFVYRTDETVGIYVSEFIAGAERVLQADTAVAGLSVASDQTLKFAALIEGSVVRGKIWANGDPEPADWQTTCTRASVRYGQTCLTTMVATGNTNTNPRVFTYNNVAVEARPFTGEVSDYRPGVDDPTHNTPYVQITASGITQRTSQGNAALESTERRWWTAGRRWTRREISITATAAGTTSTVKISDADGAKISVGDFFFLRTPHIELTTLYHSHAGSLLFQYMKEDQVFTVTSKSSSAGTTTLNFTPDASVATATSDRVEAYGFAAAADAPIAYWPMEEGSGAVNVSSGIGREPMAVVSEARPDFGGFGDSFLGSAALLKLNNAELTARVPGYVDTNEAFTVHFLCHFPETDEASGTDFIQLFCDGTAERYEIVFQTGGGDGDLRIIGTDQPTGVVLFDDAYDMGVRGKPQMAALTLYHTAPTTVQYALWTSRTLDNGVNLISGPAVATATGVTNLGKLTAIRVNPAGGFVETGIGHLAVVPNKYLYPVFAGYPGAQLSEPLYVRFQRLTYEESIPAVYCPGPTPAYRVGPQAEAAVMSNLDDLATVDRGRLYESRGAYSFEYRQRSTLVRQAPFMELDYTASSIQGGMESADDDKDTRNSVLVERVGGTGAYRAQRTSGRLSVLSPDQGGVGVYSDSQTFSVPEDKKLPDLAGWSLHLGTVDEERWPQVTVSALSGDVSLAQLFSARIGNRYRVLEMEHRGVYEPVDQLVAGYEILLDKFNPLLTLNGEPASPYSTAILTDAYTATGQGTALSANYLIATDADSVDIEIGAEVHLKTSAGALKESTIFTVTDKVSASGFTNIFFTPNAAAVTVATNYIEVTDSTRLDSSTSTLNEDLTTNETGVDVATTGGTLWTTSTAEMPFDIMIGGERMKVTAISGASSPQTFTVGRSINGVVKTHTAHTAQRPVPVSLAEPCYLNL